MKKINGVGSVFYNSNKKLWTAQYVETENAPYSIYSFAVGIICANK